jgi:hypothetical protein
MSEVGDDFNKRSQAAAMSLSLYLMDEGFTVPEGAAILAMTMATACYKFGMSEQEVMGKVGMTVRTMYKKLREKGEEQYV